MAQTRPMPLILRVYLTATRLFPALLSRRARKAHDTLGCDADRLSERLGQPTQPRPKGKLIWLHAASVGELLSVLDLAQDMAGKTGARLLFTTMTQTSARLAAQRLPEGAIHQFMPVDTPDAVRGFLDHWHPDLACFVESDIWPRLVLETHRRAIPLTLINARPSSSRAKAPKTMSYLMSCFTRLTAQDTETGAQLTALGLDPNHIAVTGDLKAASTPLEHDRDALAALTDQVKTRPTWLAASTHPGEEEPILQAHRAALDHRPDLLLILIPRHPERGPEVSNLLTQTGFSHSSRSAQQPIDQDAQVYLADTLGEMGLFFALAPLAFMGASFTDHGGHNPFEPAQLGTAVLHGPNVRNFQGDYDLLDRSGAAICVRDAADLGAAVIQLIGSGQLDRMQASGLRVMSEKAQIRQAVLDHLGPVLP